MSSTFNRRMKRQSDKNKKLGIVPKERELNIPTQNELEEYILNKTRELRMQDRFPHKELMDWKNEEHIKLLNNEQLK